MQAVEVCHRCPVRSRCLDQALEAGETLGVWGGLTPAQRAALPVADVVPIRRGDRQPVGAVARRTLAGQGRSSARRGLPSAVRGIASTTYSARGAQ